MPDGDTLYFIVFGVIAVLVIVRFGRKDKAAFEERKRSAMEDVTRSLPDSSTDQDRKDDKSQDPADERQ